MAAGTPRPFLPAGIRAVQDEVEQAIRGAQAVNSRIDVFKRRPAELAPCLAAVGGVRLPDPAVVGAQECVDAAVIGPERRLNHAESRRGIRRDGEFGRGPPGAAVVVGNVHERAPAPDLPRGGRQPASVREAEAFIADGAASAAHLPGDQLARGRPALALVAAFAHVCAPVRTVASHFEEEDDSSVVGPPQDGVPMRGVVIDLREHAHGLPATVPAAAPLDGHVPGAFLRALKPCREVAAVRERQQG